ncbi:hypothetical protein Dip510_000142 [Elusimicrobium posterum]|uniref:hypothetical protein n=1 Tax=Elusimicrobium posterum TaxID=3116653 RepID=UPI003C7723D3
MKKRLLLALLALVIAFPAFAQRDILERMNNYEQKLFEKRREADSKEFFRKNHKKMYIKSYLSGADEKMYNFIYETSEERKSEDYDAIASEYKYKAEQDFLKKIFSNDYKRSKMYLKALEKHTGISPWTCMTQQEFKEKHVGNLTVADYYFSYLDFDWYHKTDKVIDKVLFVCEKITDTSFKAQVTGDLYSFSIIDNEYYVHAWGHSKYFSDYQKSSTAVKYPTAMVSINALFDSKAFKKELQAERDKYK